MIDRIINEMIKKNIISYSEKDTYYYGMFVMLFNLLILVTIIFIGSMFGKVKETILFLLFFIPLRLYLGGYHCKTPLRCFLLTNTLFMIGIFINKYFEIYFYLITILQIIVLIYEKKYMERNIPYYQILSSICLIYLVIGIIQYACRKYIVIAIIFNYLLNKLSCFCETT